MGRPYFRTHPTHATQAVLHNGNVNFQEGRDSSRNNNDAI